VAPFSYDVVSLKRKEALYREDKRLKYGELAPFMGSEVLTAVAQGGAAAAFV
jgi:hypothetical protein